jgi:predicted alpha/beta superfamily hydrolase
MSIRLFPLLVITLLAWIGTAALSEAAYSFFADGGTFVTLDRDGAPATYHLSPSSGGTAGFDGADLGTFSLADSNTLVLAAFTNNTQESGGHFIGGGRLAHVVVPSGAARDSFSTNFSNFYVDLGDGKKAHAGTNLNVNLLAGLTAGTYTLETFAIAAGNFSPMLYADNNGSNYIATFTLINEPLPEPIIAYTPNGKVALSFKHTQDTGVGNELFLIGNHSDVGSWNPGQARKLHWTSGNVWTGQVAVEAGWALEYKYITRTNSAAEYCDGANVIWPAGDNLTATVPAASAPPYSGKTLTYYSGWTNAEVIYQSGQDTNWYTAPMTQAGPGRSAGEFRYTASGIGTPGEWLTFVPHGWYEGTETWDHSPATGGDYATPLDVFTLQDGHIYNYAPPSVFTDSQIHTAAVTSAWAPTIPSRDIRVYTPRNYATNTWKSYPVLILHDGQNVFQPGDPTYGCWNADWTADDLISLGQMRETIIVAVDNSSERLREYLPPTDDGGFGAGTGDQYLQFVLHNVMPYVQANYRVLTDADNTLALGSSFGGIASIYFGLATNRFGKVGPMSPSFWAVSNFVNQVIDGGDSSGRRIYMDCGTDENSMWNQMWHVYDLLQEDGYVVNDTLMTVVGCGQDHNEAAWAERLPEAYRFLLNIQDELNGLAQSKNPPALSLSITSNQTVQVEADTLKGQQLLLEQTPDIKTPVWSGVATSAVESLLWSTTTLTDSHPSATARFYRVTTP